MYIDGFSISEGVLPQCAFNDKAKFLVEANGSHVVCVHLKFDSPYRKPPLS